MTIKHPAVKSNLLRLVGVYELDLHLSSELDFPLRIELFHDTGRRGWFRAHVWEQQFFDLEPTFPESKGGAQRRRKTSETLLLEWSHQLGRNYNSFKASSANHALTIILNDLKRRLAHWTNIKSK